MSVEEPADLAAPVHRSFAALIGSSFSFLTRANRIRLFKPAPAQLPAVVAGIAWGDFEARICAAFRREGFRVDERGRAAPDSGIDLIAAKAKKRLLIQCKHWQTQQVSVAAVRELRAIVAARKADGGVMICGGSFTKEAQDLAEASGIRLIDGLGLAPILAAEVRNTDRLEVSSAIPVVTEVIEPQGAPDCPKCGLSMAMRQATRGKLVGHFFWICENAPSCSGIIPCTE